ncbi:hypothetical protein KEM09_04665 [Carboxylicivirga mesophila]|uniref:Mannosylglycerate hydrolase MGH1-like glycoside hydrolase domain-containing protein n=1 Tax=Carboxylicivirga mesophila TaxID=1166478 RepID=A0ABS5K6R9_9BACT|nr:trehalase family glycosidase [Carboxylicivirga mesophila]MBS2210680.1 hypothetical protein [Carboxylicivirga mesophila]
MKLIHLYITLFGLLFLTGCRINTKTHLDNEISFNLIDIPFSTNGASLALHQDAGGHMQRSLILSDVSGNSDFGLGQFIELQPEGLEPGSNIECIGHPHLVSFSVNKKLVLEACFASSKEMRFRGQSNTLQLKLAERLMNEERCAVKQLSSTEYHLELKFRFGISRYILSCLSGAITRSKEGFRIEPTNGDSYELAIRETDSKWQYTYRSEDFEACTATTDEAYRKWLIDMPAIPEAYQKAGQMGAYILWSSMLAEEGYITRPAMLMSKNWMHYIWSWDHCFNAMACSYQMPDVALDQFLIMFDHQDENGRLPDLIGRGRVIWDYLKPPVHGWCLNKLMQQIDLKPEQSENVLNKLGKWTRFWLTRMDADSNGLPEYTHGNDSGWDNGSEFDLNGKAHQWGHWESANLCTYLILQMDVLAKLADELKGPEEAKRWQQQSDELLQLMIVQLWNGERFITRNIDTGDYNHESHSLMAYLPLVLGSKLPLSIREKLIADLMQSGHITRWGLATEVPGTALYDDDGYWKGPIWAPSSLIIIDGLEQCGEHELATQLAEKFCKLCAENGFAENYNALTGEGLRDKSYTWTASVFFILAHEYLND